METFEHVITNGRPRRPCPPETWAYVERLAREQGIKDWGRERAESHEPFRYITDEDWDEYVAILDENFMAEP